MGMSWRYTPPKVNAVIRLHTAGRVAVQAAAEHLLEASQPLVPVESGALRGSGEVTVDGLTAAVSYGTDEQTAAYAAVQHERLDFAHPNGGQAKFLEQPMYTERDQVAIELAVPLRKALQE